MSIWSVTGHRPNKLGGYDNPERDIRLINLASKAINSDLYPKPDKIITGMAQGWDTCIAYTCLSLNIPFIAAIPFRGQEGMWPHPVQDEYRYLLSKAEKVEVISAGGFSTWKMMRRNAWMIEQTTGPVLALWNGDETGGTAETIKMAKSNGKIIVNLWPEFYQWAKERSR